MIKNMLIIALLALPGCGIGPSFKKPEMHVPDHYSHAVQGKKMEDLSLWWHVFQDTQLESLIEQGLSQNYDLQIALEKIEESRNINRIQIANIFPQIGLFSGVVGSNIPRNILNNQTCSKGPFSIIALDSLWELDIWGRLRKKQNAAAFEYQAQIEDMRDVLIMLIAEIAQTYISICALENKINLIKKTSRSDERILSLEQNSFASGLEDKQLPLEQIVELDQRATQIIELTIDQRVALNKLAYLLGQTPDQLNLNLSDLHAVPLPKIEIEVEHPYELLRRRPDIRKNEKLLAASYEQIGSAMAEWFPKISVLGFLGKTFGPLSGIGGGESKIWAAGPLFDWQGFDFGRIYFNIKAKQSSQRQALLTYKKSVINAVQEVENWLFSYVEQKNKLMLLEQKMSTEKMRLVLAHDRFKSGLESEAQYIKYTQLVDDIALEVIDSQEKVASSSIALYKALGGGWQECIE